MPKIKMLANLKCTITHVQYVSKFGTNSYTAIINGVVQSRGQKIICQAAPESRTPSTNYQPGNNDDTNESYYQAKVSPNVVRLDISALNFPNPRHLWSPTHRHAVSKIPIYSTEFHITGNENSL
jgi:hypothetical protein